MIFSQIISRGSGALQTYNLFPSKSSYLNSSAGYPRHMLLIIDRIEGLADSD